VRNANGTVRNTNSPVRNTNGPVRNTNSRTGRCAASGRLGRRLRAGVYCEGITHDSSSRLTCRIEVTGMKVRPFGISNMIPDSSASTKTPCNGVGTDARSVKIGVSSFFRSVLRRLRQSCQPKKMN
jgi:hypothetical protein